MEASNHVEKLFSDGDRKNWPQVVILIGPSGAGKDSIADMLIKMCPFTFARAVSSTSRPKRDGEVHGTNYNFRTREEMESAKEKGELLEMVEYQDNLYGIECKALETVLASGKTALLVMEARGARAIVGLDRWKVCCILILPPSFVHLKERLIARGKDSEEAILRRLAEAPAEINRCLETKLIQDAIINRDLVTSTFRVLSNACPR